MVKHCLVCERIAQIKGGTNDFFIAELETGYVVAGDHQFFKGYTLFLCREHVAELHQLKNGFRQRFLEEMSLVAQAVFEHFQPRKLNYEALGNAEPHLHWHLFPRYADDPNPRGPIWQVDRSLRYSESARASAEQLRNHKAGILMKLESYPGIRVRSHANVE